MTWYLVLFALSTGPDARLTIREIEFANEDACWVARKKLDDTYYTADNGWPKLISDCVNKGGK